MCGLRLIAIATSCARDILSLRSVVIFRLVLFFRTSLIFEQVLFSNKSYYLWKYLFLQHVLYFLSEIVMRICLQV